MAKTSAIQKNLRRMRLVKKYAKKRAALKKIINNLNPKLPAHGLKYLGPLDAQFEYLLPNG